MSFKEQLLFVSNMFHPNFGSYIDKVLPTLLDSLGDWINIIDKNYRIVHINKAFLDRNKKLNLDSDVIGKNLFDIYPFIKSGALPEYETVFRTKTSLNSNESFFLDGSVTHTHTMKVPLIINDRVDYVITIIKNTTENEIQLEREKQANILKKIILTFSAKLLNARPNEEPEIIFEALKEIAFFLKADRTYIYNYNPEKQLLTLFKEYSQEEQEFENQIVQDIQISTIPLFWQELRQDGYVCLLSGEEYPTEIKNEKNQFQKNQDLSFVAIGFLQNEKLQGFFGLDVKFNSVQWFEDNLTDLKLAANIFSNFFSHMNILLENQKLERQLLQAQRIESIGRLAGSIAHDFNNVLTSIMGNVTLAIMDLDTFPSNPVYFHEYLTEIKKAVEGASSLTKQLLTFSRQKVSELKVVDLNSILNNMKKMLERLIREDINLVMNLAPDLGNVRVNSGEIEQILVNLIVNARDAIVNGGKIFISTKNQLYEEKDIQKPNEIIQKKGVCLSITDTGCGMDPNVKAHLFEPFFTTKPKDKGTGLGLAIVYSLVQKNHGKINVYSEVNQGTSFKIFFPIVNDKLSDIDNQDIINPSLDRHFTIFLVEDEEAVRSTTKEFLIRLGYKILDFSNGNDALKLLKTAKVVPHLIISDVIMPGMNGRELFNEVKQIFPDIPFLFISGYTDDIVSDRGILSENDDFLSKPFTISQIDNKIQEILKKICYYWDSGNVNVVQ